MKTTGSIGSSIASSHDLISKKIMMKGIIHEHPTFIMF
jgi:hypothetical protein